MTFIFNQVSEGVDVSISDLSLEAEVTPSDLFQIMANMLREAESAMARGTAAATLSISSEDEPSEQRAASTSPSLPLEIQSPDRDQGRGASLQEEADQQGSDIGSSLKYSTSRSILHGEIGSNRLVETPIAGVDWGQVLAGPSGSSNLVTEQGD